MPNRSICLFTLSGKLGYKGNVTITGDFRTPGQLIKALLDARGWSQRVLAIVLGADETGIAKIISGKRAVSAELALLLSEVFDVPAERFLELQQSYELARARIVSQPDPNRAKRATLFGDLPVTEMIKRGWLDAFDVRDTKKIEAELIQFFGVTSLDEIEILPHAAKKTKIAADATPAQVAWIYRVKQLASELMVGAYTPFSVRSAVKKLGELLNSPDNIRKVPRILTESGIRFVIVESLTSAKIDGVCFWLDSTSPVIGMSLRFDRIDGMRLNM
jgi:HTH-type transcriptional regulator / antitoxin HigA